MSISPANIQEQGRSDWILLGLLLLAGAVATFNIGKAPPSLPLLRSELGASLRASGWIVSCIYAVGMSIGMIAGILADRLGQFRVIVGGLSLLAAGSALGGLAGSVEWLLASRLLEGLGFVAAVVPVPSLLIRAVRGRDVGTAMALWSTYMPAGTAAMMALAPLFLASVGWRGLWWINAGLCLAMLASLVLLARRRIVPPPRMENAWAGLRLTLASPGPWLIALCFGSYAMSYLAVIGFLPTYLIEQRGLGGDTAALFTALVVATNMIGNIGAGPLQRLGMTRTGLIAVGAISMAVCAAGIFTPSLADWQRLGLAIVFSALGGVIPGALFASVPVHAPAPSLAGTTNGMLLQGSNMGSTLGPPLLAIIVSQAGWPAAPWVTTASLGLCLLGALLLRWRERTARK